MSSSLTTMHYTLSTTACTCTPCQGASFPCKTDSFLWSHGPDTLACEARPSFDRCGTSLSVSLSLSLSFTCKMTRQNSLFHRIPQWAVTHNDEPFCGTHDTAPPDTEEHFYEGPHAPLCRSGRSPKTVGMQQGFVQCLAFLPHPSPKSNAHDLGDWGHVSERTARHTVHNKIQVRSAASNTTTC